MKKFFNKVMTTPIWLVIMEGLLFWFLPTIILSLLGSIIPDSILFVCYKILLIFSGIDIVFCTIYVIMSSIVNKQQELSKA